VMLQTLEAGNNGTTKWWAYIRVKPVDFAASQQLLAAMTAAGASVNRTRTGLAGATGLPTWSIFTSGSAGRLYTGGTALTVGAWNSLYLQFDGSAVGVEADTTGLITDAKARMFIGNTAVAITAANEGAGGVPAALLAATGTATIGGANDVESPVTPIRNGGQLQLMAFGSEPLTAAELAALNLFQFPT
jgi:hypothetical protein